MGKGSAPRPYSVDAETFESNWDSIFKRKPNEGQFDGIKSNTTNTKETTEGEPSSSTSSGEVE